MGITSFRFASSCTTTDARKEAGHLIQVQLPDLNRHPTDRNRFCPLRLSVYQFAGPRASAIPPSRHPPTQLASGTASAATAPPHRDPTGGGLYVRPSRRFSAAIRRFAPLFRKDSNGAVLGSHVRSTVPHPPRETVFAKPT